jgi:hypothetical protein
MKNIPFLCAALFAATASAELRVPANTGYSDPNPDAARFSSKGGVSNWKGQSISWFGELKSAGKVSVALGVKLAAGTEAKLKMTVGTESHEATVKGGAESETATFGEFSAAKAGYTRFRLESVSGETPELETLVLDGPATTDAHFNVEPRRNAASVHLAYPVDAKDVTLFYNEATAVEDPVYTYYMAAGFSRGYFGMQVNNPNERRIIFSVWDAASGQSAKDRSTVAEENHTTLLAKGEGVDAGVFGNEGTGGHSHLKYMWKTGETQRFLVAVKPDGAFTDYTGWYFHPEQKKWMMIASFRAPKDGKYLRGLYSFSENFGGSNGHLLRKARFGNGWVRDAAGKWTEIDTATFSHDGTGKAARLDRFMGVENGSFFLSQGGFVPGFTKFGEKFTRPAGKPPTDLPPGL